MNKPTNARLIMPAVPTAAVALSTVGWWMGELPGRVATHWRADGRADGSMGVEQFRLGAMALTVVLATVVVVLAWRRRPMAVDVRPFGAGLASFLAALVGGSVLCTVAANDGEAEWHAVGGPPLLWLAAIIVMACLAAAVVSRAALQLPVRIERTVRPVPSTGDASVAAEGADSVALLPPPTPGERALWNAALTAPWAVALGALMAMLGGILWFVGPGPAIGVGLLGAGAAVATLGHIDVFADRRGLTVVYGVFGWPRTRIPLDRMTSADEIEVRPMRWGGWGYRGSLLLFRRAAVVLRGGPGLRVQLQDGAVYVVTIDDAATGAAVLNRALDQRQVPGAPT